MTTTAVALCNEALRLLGDATINSFDDETDLAETCNQLYPTTVQALLAGHPWRFTMRKVQLSRDADAPLNEWRYKHALPSNRLTVRQMFNSGRVGAPPLLAYEIFENRVFSDQIDLWCDFQVETDPATWPPTFRHLARTVLAADMAVAVTGSVNLAAAMRVVAYGSPSEGGNGGLMAVARRLDAQQQPPQVLTDFPLISARFGGW
jgi:hypothetical protein